MVDMGGARQHRGHQRQHFATRVRSAHPAPQPDHPIHQIFQPQAVHQCPRRQQTRVGHQRLVVENHPVPVQIVRYSTHRKCLQTPGQTAFTFNSYCPRSEALSTSIHPNPHRWIQAKRVRG